MKRLLALILALTLLFSLSACGGDEENKAKEDERIQSAVAKEVSKTPIYDVNSVLSKAIDSIDNITSFRLKVENSADINMNGSVETISITGSGEYDVSGGRAFMDMTSKSGPLEMNTQGYIEIDGNVATVYAGVNGMWMRQSIPTVQLDTYGMGYNGVEGLKFYLQSFETESMENVGGDYVIHGHIVPERTMQVISGMGAGTQVAASGISEELISEVLDDVKKVKITFTVDAANFFVKKIEMDASDAMNAMYDYIAENVATQTPVYMRVERNTAYVEYYDYNTSINVVIPEEVKNNK